jgi:hypothetical protein|tara:strand:+ start:215 stop:466 length:252 start_codon:yes stop_codon:yes gene_type:complete
MPWPDDAIENAQNNHRYAGSYNNGMVSYDLEIVRGGNQAIRLTRLDMSFFLGSFVKTQPIAPANYLALNDQLSIPNPSIACGT